MKLDRDFPTTRLSDADEAVFAAADPGTGVGEKSSSAAPCLHRHPRRPCRSCPQAEMVLSEPFGERQSG